MKIDRYFNENQNEYKIAVRIIEMLKSTKSITIDDLFLKIQFIFEDCSQHMVFEALGFLFLIGLITYDSSIDSMVGHI
jgi:hypothetical protein